LRRFERVCPLQLTKLYVVLYEVIEPLEISSGPVRLAIALRIQHEGAATDVGKPDSQAIVPSRMFCLPVVDENNCSNEFMAIALPMLKVQLQAARCAID
jgi:hypothetical protein